MKEHNNSLTVSELQLYTSAPLDRILKSIEHLEKQGYVYTTYKEDIPTIHNTTYGKNQLHKSNRK